MKPKRPVASQAAGRFLLVAIATRHLRGRLRMFALRAQLNHIIGATKPYDRHSLRNFARAKRNEVALAALFLITNDVSELSGRFAARNQAGFGCALVARGKPLRYSAS